MEKRFKFLFLLLCCLISSSAIAQQRLRNVSKQEAFSLVKDKFSGQDVDYYLCEDPVLKIEGEIISPIHLRAVLGHFSWMPNR